MRVGPVTPSARKSCRIGENNVSVDSLGNLFGASPGLPTGEWAVVGAFEGPGRVPEGHRRDEAASPGGTKPIGPVGRRAVAEGLPSPTGRVVPSEMRPTHAPDRWEDESGIPEMVGLVSLGTTLRIPERWWASEFPSREDVCAILRRAVGGLSVDSSRVRLQEVTPPISPRSSDPIPEAALRPAQDAPCSNSRRRDSSRPRCRAA